jgi:hypothetical protein
MMASRPGTYGLEPDGWRGVHLVVLAAGFDKEILSKLHRGTHAIAQWLAEPQRKWHLQLRELRHHRIRQ